MKKKITAIVTVMTLIFSIFTINTYAAAETGYWKFKGSGGTTEFSVIDGGWLDKEVFTAAGSATFYSTLKEELIWEALSLGMEISKKSLSV